MIPTQPSLIISRHDVADVWFNPLTKHHSLHAAINFNEGDVIVNFRAGKKLDHATCFTIQTGLINHITLMPAYLQFVNHSYEPTVFFDTDTMQLKAIQFIFHRQELSFFYPSTEWKMAQAFNCHCGNGNCLQVIKGAAYLYKLTLSKFRLTTFILSRIEQL